MADARSVETGVLAFSDKILTELNLASRTAELIGNSTNLM